MQSQKAVLNGLARKGCLVIGLVASLWAVPAAKALPVTYQMEGVVSDHAFYMGSGYGNGLFKPGDAFTGEVVVDGSQLIKISYTIQSGSGQVGLNYADFSNHTIGVSPTLVYAVGNLGTAWQGNNFTLDLSANRFSHAQKYVEGSTDDANKFTWNFNVYNAVPDGGMTMFLFGISLLGLAVLRRR